jgi:hypothetical protein
MKIRLLSAVAMMSIACSHLVCGLDATAAAGKPTTAKALLPEARQAAARWQTDAVLVSVTALQANDDGTAPATVLGWNYTFHSKKSGKWIGFHGGTRGLERIDLPSGFTQPLPADFVDSDRVLAEVRKNGFIKNGETMVTLVLQADPKIKTGVYWCVAGEKEVSLELGMRGYCVDPATGRFVAKLAGRAAAAPKQTTAARSGGLLVVDLARCGGFTAAEAAAILGVPAEKVAFAGKEAGSGQVTCTFSGPAGAGIVFDVSVWKGVAEAEAEMERQRNRLNDNYRDIVGLADDGIWTEVDGSFTGRRANVTIHVTQPSDKIMKLKAAKAFFEGL